MSVAMQHLLLILSNSMKSLKMLKKFQKQISKIIFLSKKISKKFQE